MCHMATVWPFTGKRFHLFMCDTVRLAGSLGGKDLTTAWMRTDEGGGSNLMATLQVKGHLVTGWGNKVTS